MKKILCLSFVFLSTFFFHSCSGSDKDGQEVDDEPSITGVWENNNYFVSFGGGGFYVAYIADKFIDSGSYTKSKDAISCSNTYFGRNTTYVIKDISDTELNAEVTYTDLYGNSDSKNMTFTKNSKIPASQNNTLSGKSYTWSTSTFGNVSMAFNTYNSGVKSATKGSAANYPLKFFYIYVGERLYYQLLKENGIQVPTIGAWTDYNTIQCWKLSFSPNGSINDFENISETAL